MSDGTRYGHPRAGSASKPALMLALIGTRFDLRRVDLPGGENRGADLRSIDSDARLAEEADDDSPARRAVRAWRERAASRQCPPVRQGGLPPACSTITLPSAAGSGTASAPPGASRHSKPAPSRKARLEGRSSTSSA